MFPEFPQRILILERSKSASAQNQASAGPSSKAPERKRERSSAETGGRQSHNRDNAEPRSMSSGADLHLGAPLSNAQFTGEAVRAQAAVRTPQKWLLPHQPGGAGVLRSLGAPVPAHSASAAAGVELRSAGLKQGDAPPGPNLE